jgi:aldose 1-epimerase
MTERPDRLQSESDAMGALSDMKSRILICTLALVAGFATVSLRAQPSPATKTTAAQNPITIGGRSVAKLVRPREHNSTKPQLLEADFLPGRGMNLLQIKAYLPGKGEILLLASPSLDDARVKLDAPDPYGNEAFKLGGAFLLPYPNRIRGTLSPGGKSIITNASGQKISLPANWKGDAPGAELHAMHGLILNSKFQNVLLHNGPASSTISALLHARDFGGHWPSQTDVKIQAELKDDMLDLQVIATNVGHERLPMAIGMHPYFAFPSGDREQARVHMPAEMRAPANNYDDVFALGKLVPLKGTRFDFSADPGAPLNTEFVDDSFTDLQRNAQGNVEVRVTDPAARYGIKITAISKEIKTIQMYAPPTKNFVAIEPQYNLSDPYDKKVWGDQDTGVVFLKPGESTTWHVQFAIYELK